MSHDVPETPRKGVCDSLLNGTHAHTSSSTLTPLEVHEPVRKVPVGRRRCLDLINPLPGIPCSAELCGIGLTYLVFGALDVWGRLPVSFFLKDDLHWSPSQLEFWTGLKTLPWIIQPLYGFLSDAVPLLGYHRRSYIVLLSLMGVGIWIGFSQARTSAHAIAALMLGSFSEAFSITVVDSVLVTRIHGQSLEIAASLQSVCWGLQAAGKIASASVVGIMVERLKPRSCFFVVAVLPLMVACSAFVMQEKAGPVCFFGRVREGQRRAPRVMGEKLRLLRDVFMEKHLLLPALFFFLWQITPSVDSAVFYFGVNALHFSEHFYGTILLVDGCAQILGVAVYNLFLRKVPLKQVFFWTAIALISAHLLQVLLVTGYNRKLGVSDPAFMLISGAIDAGLGRIALMPLVVLAARLCPKGVEATVFGTLISLHIASHITGKVLGSALTVLFGVTSSNFTNLGLLMLVCAISRFLPLPLLFLLPDKMTQEDEAQPSDAEKAAVQNIGVGAVEDVPNTGRTSTPVP